MTTKIKENEVLGHRIREQRKLKLPKSNNTQSDLGALLEPPLKTSAMSSYERGESTLPIKYLIQVAEIFDCTTDYLLGLTEDPHTSRFTLKDIQSLDNVSPQTKNELMRIGLEKLELYESVKNTGLSEDQLLEILDVVGKFNK